MNERPSQNSLARAAQDCLCPVLKQLNLFHFINTKLRNSIYVPSARWSASFIRDSS